MVPNICKQEIRPLAKIQPFLERMEPQRSNSRKFGHRGSNTMSKTKRSKITYAVK